MPLVAVCSSLYHISHRESLPYITYIRESLPYITYTQQLFSLPYITNIQESLPYITYTQQLFSLPYITYIQESLPYITYTQQLFSLPYITYIQESLPYITYTHKLFSLPYITKYPGVIHLTIYQVCPGVIHFAIYHLYPGLYLGCSKCTIHDCSQMSIPPNCSYMFLTPNQCKTCIKHTFLTKKIMQKKEKITNLPTLFFSDCYRKQTIFFSWPYVCIPSIPPFWR